MYANYVPWVRIPPLPYFQIKDRNNQKRAGQKFGLRVDSKGFILNNETPGRRGIPPLSMFIPKRFQIGLERSQIPRTTLKNNEYVPFPTCPWAWACPWADWVRDKGQGQNVVERSVFKIKIVVVGPVLSSPRSYRPHRPFFGLSLKIRPRARWTRDKPTGKRKPKARERAREGGVDPLTHCTPRIPPPCCKRL